MSQQTKQTFENEPIEVPVSATPTSFEDKINSLLEGVGGELTYYGYDLQINELVTGERGVMVTVKHVYHDWLQHESLATSIVEAIYTSDISFSVGYVTVFFEKDGKNMAKLSLDAGDAYRYEDMWGEIMWIKREGWSDSYFDTSLKANE